MTRPMPGQIEAEQRGFIQGMDYYAALCDAQMHAEAIIMYVAVNSLEGSDLPNIENLTKGYYEDIKEIKARADKHSNRAPRSLNKDAERLFGRLYAAHRDLCEMEAFG